MANQIHYGSQVICNGYPGRVTEICTGQLEGMVVVQLERGSVCVGISSLKLGSVAYQVIDTQTGNKVAGPFKSKTRAYRKADKLDLEYGAIRYSVRPA